MKHNTYNPDAGFPRVLPELVYGDVAAAIAWLSQAFGFRELLRWTAENGEVGHADLELEGGIVMLTSGGAGYRNPASIGQVSVRLLVYVRDVDQHCRLAKENGATILSEPRDKPWGLRQYVVADPEGHLWEFTQHVRDVAPEAWGATASC